MAHSSHAQTHSRSDWPWDGLLAFHAAARAGSLSQAAELLGISQPTVGRRIDAFEAAVGARVLHRDARGCRPTALGERLLPHVEQVMGHADVIDRLVRARRDEVTGVVRVACGPLLGRLLARRMLSIIEGAPGLQIEIAPAMHFADLDAGEADIALRNRRPTSGDLVARRIGTNPFAVYGSPLYVDAHPAARDPEGRRACRWIGYLAGARAPSAVWLREHLGREPAIRLDASLAILEAAAEGAGLCVLPTVAGDDEPRLMRLGEPVDGLVFEGWLVMRSQTRDAPRVRWVVDRLLAILGREPEMHAPG